LRAGNADRAAVGVRVSPRCGWPLHPLRRPHGGSWLAIVLRAAVVAFVDLVLFALAVAALVVAAVMLR